MTESSRKIFSDIKIIDCNGIHANDWNQYLESSSDASFYQLFGWNRINKKHFSHEVYNLAAFDDEKIVGIFPLVYINSRIFGKILCSMPFVNFGGPCANSPEIEKKLLNAATEIARNNGVDYLEMRLTKIIDESLPCTQEKVSMTLELSNDPDDIWNHFNSKHRTNIRRVYKNDIEVRAGHKNLLNDFYKILSESWRHLGTPIYSKKYFKEILESFENNKQVKIVQGKITNLKDGKLLNLFWGIFYFYQI